MAQPSEYYLSDLPKFTSLLPAILCKSNKIFKQDQALPNGRFWVENIQLNTDKITAFNQLTDWQHSEIVHPGFLHTLGFLLQLKVMLQKDFPFSMLGVVHIVNMIEQYSAIHPASRVDVCCQLTEMRQLKIGCLFSLETEYFVGQQRVMRAKHQYLRRADKDGKRRARLPNETKWLASEQDQAWSLPSGLGWQYARCSQDYNPIHLHSMSAKLLGFKQHIAHGMWMKSRAFSALCAKQPAKLQGALSCDVEFKKPLFLPNSVIFQSRPTQAEPAVDFCISSNLKQQPVEHMTGRLEFLDN